MLVYIQNPPHWGNQLIQALNHAEDIEHPLLDTDDDETLEHLAEATCCFLLWGYRAGGEFHDFNPVLGDIIQGFDLWTLNATVLLDQWIGLLRFHWDTLVYCSYGADIQSIDPVLVFRRTHWVLEGWSLTID